MFAERFFKILNDMAQGVFHIAFALGTAEVGNNHNFGTFVHQFFNGGNRAVNAGGVGYVKIFIHRHIQISAQHCNFAVQIAQILDCFIFCHLFS